MKPAKTGRLGLVLALGTVLLTLSPPAAYSQTSSPAELSAVLTRPPEAIVAEVEFRQLQPGVWLHSSYKNMPRFGRVLSNGLLIEQGDHFVLVDTAWDDAQTRGILDWANAQGRPVSAAIVTHSHEDKMGGIAALKADGIESFANARTNALAREAGRLPADVSLTFTASGNLDRKSRRLAKPLGNLIVFYPGAGHTDDNIVVATRGGHLLFGGCLIRPADATDLGNTADANVPNWANAVRRVAARFPDASVVIPSHGGPSDASILARTVRLASRPK